MAFQSKQQNNAPQEHRKIRITDNIDKLVDEIKNDPTIKRLSPCGFSAKLLNNVANIFESKGFGTTERFLKGEEGRENRAGALALLCVLEKLRGCQEVKNAPGIGRYIFKTMNTITIERIERDILNDNQIRNAAPNQINETILYDISKTYEERGIRSAKNLLDTKYKEIYPYDVARLHLVLNKIQTCSDIGNAHRIGSHIIKNLNAILKKETTPC